MREFIVRARAAPVDATRFREAIGGGLGVEYLADIVRHGIFVSQGHRSDTAVSLVLEKSHDYSRVVEIRGDTLGSLPDIHERSILELVAGALAAGSNLGKHDSVRHSGVTVTAMSFEQLVRQRAESGDVILLDAGGDDLRAAELPPDPVFVLTDHTPMPKNTFKSMARQGVRSLSLGPVMLHAAQCISILHHELDYRGSA